MPIEWYHLFAFYLAFFLINPDYDLIFGINDHRSFITHSIIYPTLLYWAFHDFWNMENAKVLGLVIYYPVLIHLLCDYKIGDKGAGSWRISWNFLSVKIGSKRIGFKHKRMSKIGSILWFVWNVIFIILYVLWIWEILDFGDTFQLLNIFT